MMVKTRSPVALDKRLDDDYQRVFVGVCVCGEGWSDGVGGMGRPQGWGPAPRGGWGPGGRGGRPGPLRGAGRAARACESIIGQICARNKQENARNMQEYAHKYAEICKKYAAISSAKWAVHIYYQYAKSEQCTILHIDFGLCILFCILQHIYAE